MEIEIERARTHVYEYLSDLRHLPDYFPRTFTNYVFGNPPWSGLGAAVDLDIVLGRPHPARLEIVEASAPSRLALHGRAGNARFAFLFRLHEAGPRRTRLTFDADHHAGAGDATAPLWHRVTRKLLPIVDHLLFGPARRRWYRLALDALKASLERA